MLFASYVMLCRHSDLITLSDHSDSSDSDYSDSPEDGSGSDSDSDNSAPADAPSSFYADVEAKIALRATRTLQFCPPPPADDCSRPSQVRYLLLSIFMLLQLKPSQLFRGNLRPFQSTSLEWLVRNLSMLLPFWMQISVHDSNLREQWSEPNAFTSGSKRPSPTPKSSEERGSVARLLGDGPALGKTVTGSLRSLFSCGSNSLFSCGFSCPPGH